MMPNSRAERHISTIMKVVNLVMLVVVVCAILLPFEEVKSTLPHLKSKRQLISYLLMAWVLIYELRVLVLITMVRRTANPEAEFAFSSDRKTPLGRLFAGLSSWEKRFWLYALMIKVPAREAFEGVNHFGSGKQNGNASAWLGWAIVNLVPTPIIHILLHQKSPLAAGLSTLACLMSSLWLWAEYRAATVRPISLDMKFLYLRYGLTTNCKIDRGSILSVKAVTYLDSLHGVRRYAGFGSPNVLLKLKSGEELAIGVDEPTQFIKSLMGNLHAFS